MASSLGSTLADASDVFCGCDYCGDGREAAGFCKTCEDYLCAECFNSHLKPRPLRHHVLLDRGQMPCPEDRNRRGADSDTCSQDDQSSDSSPLGALDISTRPGLIIGFPEPAEQGARYRPTRASGRACIKTTALLVSAVLTLLMAVWLEDRYSRPVARKTHAEHVGDIAVIHVDDEDIGYNEISGSVVMPGERLVTVYPRSSRVKLVDMTTNTMIAQLQLLPGITDIFKINDTQVAVTGYNKGTNIVFVNISDDELKLGHSVRVNSAGSKIVGLHDNLLVTFYYLAKVEILNMKGQFEKTVVTETQGKRLFVHPGCVAVSPDQSTIYISDSYKDTVTRLTLTGEVLATYIPQDKASLDEPRGLVVDKSGSVYVCGFDSHNVVQLAADLTQPRQLLQESDGVKWPRSVSYCQATDRLYIAMWQSRVVKVYQLK